METYICPNIREKYFEYFVCNENIGRGKKCSMGEICEIEIDPEGEYDSEKKQGFFSICPVNGQISERKLEQITTSH